jgi:hypothetical protein
MTAFSESLLPKRNAGKPLMRLYLDSFVRSGKTEIDFVKLNLAGAQVLPIAPMTVIRDDHVSAR